jgi:hypothetical protein
MFVERVKREKENKHACFICLEQNHSLDYLHQANLSLSKISQCKCNGWVHLNCLDKWYHIKNRCPACNTNIMIIHPDFIIHDNIQSQINQTIFLPISQFCLWFLFAYSFVFFIILISYMSYCFYLFLHM